VNISSEISLLSMQTCKQLCAADLTGSKSSTNKQSVSLDPHPGRHEVAMEMCLNMCTEHKVEYTLNL